MTPLPRWMRRALFATAAMNGLAALGFLPASGSARALAGLPEDAPPVYLLIIGLFVLLFGLGYLWTALMGRADRLFIALAAIGKLSFVGLLVHGWRGGALPIRAPLTAAPDLVFGLLFIVWLVSARAGQPATRVVATTESTVAPARG
jgi:hypothetical protein